METSDEDAAEIRGLEEKIARQRRAHRAGPVASAARRRERLQALIAALTANRLRIREAILADYGYHPVLMTDLVEVQGAIARAQAAIAHLDEWMAKDLRPQDASFANARAWMEPQPKGVIGNMVPWNFPFELGCGPLSEMLAAGNRVIIKPSELTPACGQVMREMIAAAFDEDVVTTVLGGTDVARAFAAAPWDHLLFTGSTAVGRQVMRAAAERLTPVTMELGGKCPAILTQTGVDARSVESIIGLKLIKSGQVCVSVDHVFVPRGQVARFVELVTAYVRKNTPGYSHSADCTSIISEAHFDRLASLVADARAHGGEIVVPEVGAVADRTTRRMPLTLVLGANENMRLASEEVFGPILPVHAYDELANVIEYLAAGDKPLTVSVFGTDQAELEHVVAATVSGGITVNGASLHAATLNMGFGGVGASGMGRHHGVEGFREFSNLRAVFVRGDEREPLVIFPPYREAAQAAVDFLFPADAECAA